MTTSFIFLYIICGILTWVLFYFVAKAAVKNGIREAYNPKFFDQLITNTINKINATANTDKPKQSLKIDQKLKILNDFIVSKNYLEIVNHLNATINSKEDAETILDNYLIIYSQDLVDDLKNISNSYDKIKNCLQRFIDFELVEAKYPHERKQ